MPRMDEAAIWEIMGEKGIRDMVAAFYRRVPGDDLLGPMYPADDMAGAEERLADFLCFRIGAQMGYMLKRGHPRLRMRHAPFSIGQPESDRWMKLMREAMTETAVPAECVAWLDPFFAQVATFMHNRPDGAAAAGDVPGAPAPG